MVDAALHRLADAAGLLIHWEDADGVDRTVSEDSLRAVLAGMGLPCETRGDCRASAAALRDERSPALIVGTAGEPLPLHCTGPIRVTLEDGRRIDLPAGAPIALDVPGYHHVSWAGGEQAVAVAPRRCRTPERRMWGTAVQLYALREGHAFGDFGDLADFAAVMGGAGADALAISPVHALFAADATRFSPYSPSSRQFLNPLFAAVGGAGETGDALIDWPAASAAKWRALRQAYAADGQSEAFARFERDADAALRQHARFEALHGHFARIQGAQGWQAWPTGYHAPDTPEVRAFAAEYAEEVRFHLFAQFAAGRGLEAAQAAAVGAGMALGLIADVAVGLDPGGSHAWSRPEELLSGLRIGAPPDAFQAAGQNWGITSYAPQGLAESGYRPFIAMLRTAFGHGGGVRIDHALGLRRLWVVPEGAAPLEGAYLRQPERDLLRLIALESHRSGGVVIAEDLGVVPPGFRDAIAGKGMLGMRVLPFERDADGGFTDPEAWDAAAVAMTSTHDLTPIAGWWQGGDIAWRDRLGEDTGGQREEREADRARFWSTHGSGAQPEPIDGAAAADAAVAAVAGSACALAIVPAEDLFALTEAPNLPGTIDTHPNWRRRYPADAATLLAEPATRARVATLCAERPR